MVHEILQNASAGQIRKMKMPHPGLELPPPEGQDLQVIKMTCRELQRYLAQKHGEVTLLGKEIATHQVGGKYSPLNSGLPKACSAVAAGPSVGIGILHEHEDNDPRRIIAIWGRYPRPEPPWTS